MGAKATAGRSGASQGRHGDLVRLFLWHAIAGDRTAVRHFISTGATLWEPPTNTIGPNRRLLEQRCERPSWRFGVFVSAACSGERSECCARSTLVHSMACSRAGLGSAFGVGCWTGYAATGGAPVGILRSRAPWSSIVDPAARRRAVFIVVSTAKRRSGASKAVDEYGIPLAIDVSPPNRHDTKVIVPVLRALVEGGFQGPALGDRGERLAEAGEGLGITVKALACGRDTDGSSRPASAGWLNGPLPG